MDETINSANMMKIANSFLKIAKNKKAKFNMIKNIILKTEAEKATKDKASIKKSSKIIDDIFCQLFKVFILLSTLPNIFINYFSKIKISSPSLKLFSAI